MKEAKYIKASIEENSNKFWSIEISNTTVITRWGRVGEKGQSKTFNFTSLSSAENFFSKKCKEKEKSGYSPQQVLNNTIAKPAPAIDLVKVAKEQIKTNSPELIDLITYLAKANIHNILQNTTLTYDVKSGLFSTPLGYVTLNAIEEARDILLIIGNLVNNKEYDNAQWSSLINKYLMTIPQDIGRQKPTPEKLFPNLGSVVSQNKLLDDLESSLQMSTRPTKQKAKAEQVFNVKLYLEDNNKNILRIEDKYNQTRQAIHAASRFEVARVFIVEIETMANSFNKIGKPLGNIMELWHGTRVGNLLSILKGGLMCPPSSSPHVTGRMFGDGLYFSDQSTKSLNYAYGVAPGQRGNLEDSVFMFLADVAMGTPFIPTRTTPRSYPKDKFNSTFAQANVSGVMNNEMIVYNTDQCNLTYLIEFSRK